MFPVEEETDYLSMFCRKALIISTIVCISICVLPSFSQAADNNVPTPTIDEIKILPINPYVHVIYGQTRHGTEVLVYLNGSFIDLAKTDNTGTEFDQYSLVIEDSLIVNETGRVMVIARDRTSLRLSAPSAEEELVKQILPAPTLVFPTPGIITTDKPLITGLTVSGTAVEVYVDGQYDGETSHCEDVSGTANFAYSLKNRLVAGNHAISLAAKDSQGRVSRLAEQVLFKTVLPLPAPTLLAVLDKTAGRPAITGLAKNNSTVQIFIDDLKVDQFRVKNQLSGTANFAYMPVQSLTKGKHFVYTVACDQENKISTKSNIIYFESATVKEPKITQIASRESASETMPADEEITDVTVLSEDAPIGTESEENEAINSDLSAETEENEAEISKDELKIPAVIDDDIKNILEGQASTSAPAGIINESEKSQSKLQLNLIIFILFLAAVVVWIFWVNRELIKERKDQETKEKEQTGRKD